MSYAHKNFKTKKELKEAVKEGKQVRLKPSVFDTPLNGPAWVEGPWAPAPHVWYAEVEMKDGLIVKVK
jgi:hypothetical protein